MIYAQLLKLGGQVMPVVLSQRAPDLTPRVHIEFSAASNVAAIVRRGPTRWVRLLSWNTADDKISLGSWFHGRIYEDGCSVSPNGELFAYFATKYGGPKSRGVEYAWTAISKLPWLTALALWPQSETYGGNAKFADNKTLIIDCPHWERLRTDAQLPKGFSVVPRWIGNDAPYQNLPPIPEYNASFDGKNGVDQNGRTFQYVDGKLVRDGRLIVDLTMMVPAPEPSPDYARTW